MKTKSQPWRVYSFCVQTSLLVLSCWNLKHPCCHNIDTFVLRSRLKTFPDPACYFVVLYCSCFDCSVWSFIYFMGCITDRKHVEAAWWNSESSERPYFSDFLCETCAAVSLSWKYESALAETIGELVGDEAPTQHERVYENPFKVLHSQN